MNVPTVPTASAQIPDHPFHRDKQRPTRLAILQSIIDFIGVEAAILDERGVILATNSAWDRDAAGPLASTPGMNYFKVCVRAARQDKIAEKLAESLQSILSDETVNDRACFIDTEWHRIHYSLSRFRLQDHCRMVVVCREAVRHSEIEQHQLRVSRRLQVQEYERRRIARDLHDSTSQHLVAVSLLLPQLQQPLGERDEGKSLDEVSDVVAEALEELRSFCFLLHPPRLDRDGIAASLASLVTGYSRRINLPISFTSSKGSGDSLKQVESLLFRLTQEVLANIHRHAETNGAAVSLYWTAEEVELAIGIEGAGFDTAAVEHDQEKVGGMLAVMGQVFEFGGSLTISLMADGLKMITRLPLTPAMRTAWHSGNRALPKGFG
jgi:signal transduction histidine kinase